MPQNCVVCGARYGLSWDGLKAVGEEKCACLSFAEAYRLHRDGTPVDVMVDGRWTPLVTEGLGSFSFELLDTFMVTQFRRSRPKRSRVQEMARQCSDAGVRQQFAEEDYVMAIRAVCDYLRSSGKVIDGHRCEAAAGGIEREFLEPR